MTELLALLGVAAAGPRDEAEDPLAREVSALWDEYLQGRVHPEVLARLARPASLDGNVQNTLVCLEVAAGRYREALAWHEVPVHGVWSDEGRGLVRLNVAEALACLGRLEDSLAMTDFPASTWGLLEAGVAAHRAWVLAELGRIDEARATLERSAAQRTELGDFEAEWHFSAFVVALAARDFMSAGHALDAAAACAVRGSSERNVHFLRGRLEFARGDVAAAVAHFERGGALPYLGQGGAALLEWGDALAQLGREEEARAIWARCVRDDPQSPSAIAAARRK